MTDASSALARLVVEVASDAGDASDGDRYNALWRLVRLAEWFTELADTVGATIGKPPAQPFQIAVTQAEANRAWAAAVDHSGPADKVRARGLARRALATVALARAARGRLLNSLAFAEAQAAERWAGREQPTITRVIGFAEFPTSSFVIKGQLLDPSRPQTVRLLLANETARSVTATVRAKFPEGWLPGTAAATCTAGPGEVVVAGEVQVTVPNDQPWERKSAWRPCSALDVLCPAELPPNQGVDVWAEMGSAQTVKAGYYFAMGTLAK
jgi:hypothetical protein